ncbi:MAG: nuclear transport factor 2 family protein [Candidatus Eremiobacteraeota bacterium]|nr:nuclear transport factor 2 family protein [Candidatus Eremiobacteraeota bacterium]
MKSSILTIALAVASVSVSPHLAIASQASDNAKVKAQLVASARAFERHDLTTLAKVFVNDRSLTIYEGGEVNTGWIDYRDNHLKPELAEIKSVRYTLSSIVSHVDDNTAWATFNYHIVGSTAKRKFDSRGIGTAVLLRVKDTWRIVHWHSTKAPKHGHS